MTSLSPGYRFLASGRTALDADDAAVRAMIRSILFTMPGERVNRPGFGSAIAGQVFAGNNELLAAAAQATAQTSLQRYLGDRIAVESVEVSAIDAVLSVTVSWMLRATGARGIAQFEAPAG